MRIITAILLALALSLGISAPASAGVWCDRAGICGDVYYAGGDRPYLVTYCDWSNKRDVDLVWPGEWSECADTDGFLIPSSCVAQLAGSPLAGFARIKVRDPANVRVGLYCR